MTVAGAEIHRRREQTRQFVHSQEGLFKASDVAEALGVHLRVAYRHLAHFRRTDNGLQGEAGIGYLYRRTK